LPSATAVEAIAAEQANEVQRAKQELLRLNFAEQARTETRKLAVSPTEGQPSTGLKPWREVITPHPDVASGKFQQAEFAADLGQVYRGDASDEYGKPRDFFQRTFMTHGLEQLLVGALKRLSGTGGDPVVELQTNFGGGKTHSMLALYHLFSGAPASDLAGVEQVLKAAGLNPIPKAKRAALVGTDIGPAVQHRKPDGTGVNTLWGELAWQLLGKDGYKIVAESDKKGVSPGGELRELFKRAAPCIVLIDEWLAHARMLYGVSDLPAGSFDANMTFAQALTEAAKASPKTIIVASIPASDTEIGGEGGRAALERIKNVFARVQSPWTPASTDEGFEIVRRRLFQAIADPELFRARDAVAKKFREM
jgi:predicted AAA+ superfamily ATPase